MNDNSRNIEISIPVCTVSIGSELMPQGAYEPEKYWRILRNVMLILPIGIRKFNYYLECVGSQYIAGDPGRNPDMRRNELRMHYKVAYQHDSDQPEKYVSGLDIYVQHNAMGHVGATYVTVAAGDSAIDLHDDVKPEAVESPNVEPYLLLLLSVIKFRSELKDRAISELALRLNSS